MHSYRIKGVRSENEHKDVKIDSVKEIRIDVGRDMTGKVGFKDQNGDITVFDVEEIRYEQVGLFG